MIEITSNLVGMTVMANTAHYYLISHLDVFRHGWDAYLVDEENEEGSSIPNGWIVPVTPSNEIWATALKENQPLHR